MCTLNVFPSPPRGPASASRRRRARPRRPGRSATSRGAARSRWRRRRPRILPGQRTMSGTRKAPSQFVFFSLRNGVIAPSGHVFMCGPLSVPYMTIVSSAISSSSSRVEELRRRWRRDRASCRGSSTASGRPCRGFCAWCAFATCMWVVFTQQKNGLRRLCWRFMKSPQHRRTRRRTSPFASASAGPCP